METNRHDSSRKCLTDGCEGTPFFGETLSPGYCDSCHTERATMLRMLQVMYGLETASIHEDETAYYEQRDRCIAYAETHAGAETIARAFLPV